MFDEVYSMSDVFSWYVNFLEQLQAKVEKEVAAHDPTLLETVEAVGHCLELCRHGQEKVREGLRDQMVTRDHSVWGMPDTVVERGLQAMTPTLAETVEVVGHCLDPCRQGQEKVRKGLWF